MDPFELLERADPHFMRWLDEAKRAGLIYPGTKLVPEAMVWLAYPREDESGV